MSTPLTTLREMLDAWRRDEAMERVRVWQGADDALDAVRVAARHRGLLHEKCREALHNLRANGLGDAHTEALLRAHWARAAAEQELARERVLLAHGASTTIRVAREEATLAALCLELTRAAKTSHEIGSTLERAAVNIEARLRRASMAASERALTWLVDSPPRPDAGPARADLLDEARLLFAKTDDLAVDLVARLSREAHLEMPDEWHGVLAALRAPHLDSLVPRRERFRRIGTHFAALGFEPQLAKHVRVVGTHDELDLRTRLAIVDPPRDVRIAISKLELGLWSEMLGQEAVARSLALTLAESALPVEARRPLDASIARTMGMLFMHLYADPLFHRRVRGIGRADADRLALAATAITVLDTRVAVAALLARNEETRTPEEQREMAGTWMSRVVKGVRVPVELASLIALTPAALGARFRAKRAALSLHVSLRELYDDDWYANPRMHEMLRALCARAGATSIERVAQEQDLSVEDAPQRLDELASF